MRNILIFLLLFTSFGCSTSVKETDYEIKLVNVSSHAVIIEVDDWKEMFPASLELLPGDSYQWMNLADYQKIHPFNAAYVYITFDGLYTVRYPGNFARDFNNPAEYTFSDMSNGRVLATFTFTDDDYENAVIQSQ